MAQTAEKKTEKSYLSSAVDSINPWAAGRVPNPDEPKRSTTPTTRAPTPAPTPDRPRDHSTNPLYGISRSSYPQDCPPLNVLWFHATDVAKRKPKYASASFSKNTPKDSDKPPPPPKKFAAFQSRDSRSIEAAYQRLLGGQEGYNVNPPSGAQPPGPSSHRRDKSGQAGAPENGDISGSANVPVNEDFLFDVNILKRELSPVYWHGPVYEVRRGTWFYQEGSSLRPCEENLAAQLEEGYLKTKPWLIPAATNTTDMADPTSKSDSTSVAPPAGEATEKESLISSPPDKPTGTATPPPQPPSYRLFGTYMNSVATYQDSATAWVSSDGIISWVTSSVYQRFAGGGYMSGIKLVRGYSESGKTKDSKRPKTPTESPNTLKLDDEKEQRAHKRNSAPPSTKAESSSATGEKGAQPSFGSGSKHFEEEIRRRAEIEIRDDYNVGSGESQGRDIEHLVLVTHGIGQLLSLRLESMNFIHDVNVFRKTLKSVYSSSADLKALNGEQANKAGNCRVQVLPVCWRHHLDFPKKRDTKPERDLGVTAEDEDAYPSLDDITIEGVAFARSIVSDLALDILLYQSGYREPIMTIVVEEANRIYNLFKERNPEFKGKVHLVGHSLGAAIIFDLLCRQRGKTQETRPSPLRLWPSAAAKTPPTREPGELVFDFDVQDLYCLGSPVGLFQMLKGSTISARRQPDSMPSQSPLDPESAEDMFRNSGDEFQNERISPITGLPSSVSSPRLSQLFNIFHPSDPISYRIEPLIAPLMSTLKPQALPYTKKSIFGNVAPQSLSGLGAKVGQSVSDLWSSLSAGVTSNLLNRSLGLTSEEVARITAASSGPSRDPADMSTEQLAADSLGERSSQLKRELADKSNPPGRVSMSGNDVTLIDYDLETLFSKFEKGRTKSDLGDSRGAGERDPTARKMRLQEARVRALNRNGRVDYGIQESVLDYNPINTIASHMSYWGDEDVNHFVLSQLLSNKSKDRTQ